MFILNQFGFLLLPTDLTSFYLHFGVFWMNCLLVLTTLPVHFWTWLAQIQHLIPLQKQSAVTHLNPTIQIIPFWVFSFTSIHELLRLISSARHIDDITKMPGGNFRNYKIQICPTEIIFPFILPSYALFTPYFWIRKHCLPLNLENQFSQTWKYPG